MAWRWCVACLLVWASIGSAQESFVIHRGQDYPVGSLDVSQGQAQGQAAAKTQPPSPSSPTDAQPAVKGQPLSAEPSAPTNVSTAPKDQPPSSPPVPPVLPVAEASSAPATDGAHPKLVSPVYIDSAVHQDDAVAAPEEGDRVQQQEQDPDQDPDQDEDQGHTNGVGSLTRMEAITLCRCLVAHSVFRETNEEKCTAAVAPYEDQLRHDTAPKSSKLANLALCLYPGSQFSKSHPELCSDLRAEFSHHGTTAPPASTSPRTHTSASDLSTSQAASTQFARAPGGGGDADATSTTEQLSASSGHEAQAQLQQLEEEKEVEAVVGSSQQQSAQGGGQESAPGPQGEGQQLQVEQDRILHSDGSMARGAIMVQPNAPSDTTPNSKELGPYDSLYLAWCMYPGSDYRRKNKEHCKRLLTAHKAKLMKTLAELQDALKETSETEMFNEADDDEEEDDSDDRNTNEDTANAEEDSLVERASSRLTRLKRQLTRRGQASNPMPVYMRNVWPGGVIPFYLVKDGPNALAPDQAFLFGFAVEHYARQTCLKFKEVNPTDKVHALRVQGAPNGCSAEVGYRGEIAKEGKATSQFIKLSARCTPGNAVHELGHVVGFLHTQQRGDRDNVLQVMLNNVKPQFQREYSKTQDVAQTKDIFHDIGSFDYGSLMGYPAKSTLFSVQTGENFVMHSIKEPRARNEDKSKGGMGQRLGLSYGDVYAIGQLYECKISAPKDCVCPAPNEYRTGLASEAHTCETALNPLDLPCQRYCRGQLVWATSGCWIGADTPTENVPALVADATRRAGAAASAIVSSDEAEGQSDEENTDEGTGEGDIESLEAAPVVRGRTVGASMKQRQLVQKEEAKLSREEAKEKAEIKSKLETGNNATEATPQ